MNNTQLRTLSFVAEVASTLLSVAVITAVSTIEEADARHKSSTSTSQSIRQSNNGDNGDRNSNSATNSDGSSSTTCNNGVCTSN
jgi:hypothetical protein